MRLAEKKLSSWCGLWIYWREVGKKAKMIEC